MLMFDGTLMVGFDPDEVEGQIEFLSSVEPANEEDADKLHAVLLQVIENKKHSVS